MTRYRAKAGLSIPMPGRPGELVPEVGDGIRVDEQSTYYLRLIADGDLVAVPEETAQETAQETTPAGGKAEGKK